MVPPVELIERHAANPVPGCPHVGQLIQSVPTQHYLQSKTSIIYNQQRSPVLRIRIHRIHMFLGLLDPDPDLLIRGMDPDPSIIKQKKVRKNLDFYCFVILFGL
jgi:hypothetical protein